MGKNTFGKTMPLSFSRRKSILKVVSLIVKDSKHIGLKSSYIKNKGFDDDYFKKLIVEYIAKFGKASRTELSQLLTDKLPDTLSESQWFDKITNLLSSLRKSGIIRVGEKRMCNILITIIPEQLLSLFGDDVLDGYI